MKARQRKPRCLVVESEWGWRNLLEDILGTSEVEVIVATTDAEAIKILKTEQPMEVDVVICQAPPPGAKHSLVGKIRSLKQSKEVPVICTSPSSGLQDRAQAFEQGGTDYLVRPIAPITLVERVKFWAAREHRPF